MRINLNQSLPFVSGSFKRYYYNRTVKPKFPFQVYDSDVNTFGIVSLDLNLTIICLLFIFQMVSIDSLLLVEDTAKITCLIQSNKKISIYYENIPTKVEGSGWQTNFRGFFACGSGDKKHEISVPSEWIQSRTLVVYEAIGKYCSEYNSSETCQNITASNTTCIWCANANTCIESNDEDTHKLKENDCRVQVSTC
ncbi:hypothetical protein MS3_00011161 [Schistosoma haematobium]|uniref:Egg protein CP391S-like protein n=1 Tax=Schistosoma haematobium TaxID=6185 RepID=A0A922IGZ8_SCHHA|nr:hypothetical protein MS3_00011161 [Schistosoma haematobium]KAH9579127.1 hypothetical protein MS3_00011161 [Schistosoma haematobium]